MSGAAASWRGRRLRCGEAVHARLFDEELVILDLSKGEYFALDDIGARLWAGLEAGRTVEQIAEDVVGLYEVDRELLIEDLVALSDDLVREGLLVVDSSP